MYLLTLVLLKVQTLQECLAMADTSGLQRPQDLQNALLWGLRQYLRAVAAGEPDFSTATCPALHPEACFDEATGLGYGLMIKVWGHLQLIMATVASSIPRWDSL